MINIEQLDTSEFKTCDGVTIEGNSIKIDFAEYYKNAKERAHTNGKSYTMPAFVPNAIEVDLGKIALESWLSCMTSQATPLLKRFYNALIQNYKSQADCDSAITKVKTSLYEGCHARLAQGESNGRLSPLQKAINDVARAICRDRKIKDAAEQDAIKSKLAELVMLAQDTNATLTAGQSKTIAANNARIEFHSREPQAIEATGLDF